MSLAESVGIPEEELAGDLGKPAIDVMVDIRNMFMEEEPFVADYEWNDPLNKREVRLTFSAGIDADWSRLDVTWYTSGAYKFQYIDSNDHQWRFDRHSNHHSPEKHFHVPPDAKSTTAIPSCITVEEPQLVARAVHQLWRRAFKQNAFDRVNTANNPP